MATLSQLIAQRATAGSRYYDAVVDLRAAYIDLRAIELALSNDNIAGAGASSPDALSQFRGDADMIPVAFQHPVYAPGNRGGMIEDAKAGFDAIVANFPNEE